MGWLPRNPGRPLPAAHRLAVDEYVAPVEVLITQVVELVDPHAMVERLFGRAVGFAIHTGQVLDMAKVGEVHVGSGVTQTRRERQRGLLRRHDLVALGVRKPQRRLGERGYVLVRGVEPRGTAGKARGEEIGVVGAQAQGHKAAVGKTGDHDAVGVDAVGVLGDELVDERLEHGGVDALVGAAEQLYLVYRSEF